MAKIKERKNVLVSRFMALGDVAMTLPSVYDACIANPEVKFYYLTQHHPARILINRPANLTVVPVNTDNYKGIGGIRRLARSLRKRYEITDYLDLQDELPTRLLRFFLRLSGVRVHYIDAGRRAGQELTRRNNKVLVQLKPMPERYRDVFYKAGIAIANDFEGIFGKERGDVNAFASVTPPKKPGEYWMAVAPFAKYKGKMYPLDLLERVIDHFSRKPATKIFVFGFGEDEIKIIGKMARRYPSVVNIAEAGLGPAAELSLFSHCDVMLSMDAANMHLASLVGLRTVSIWGASHPYTGYMGWHQRTRDVVQLDMTCRPCSVYGDKPCFRGDYHCLAGITPKMIIDRIENQSTESAANSIK